MTVTEGRIDIDTMSNAIEVLRTNDPTLTDALAAEVRDLQFGRI